MNERDTPDSTATATATVMVTSPFSLKSMAQDLLLDTLEPHQRKRIAEKVLSLIPDDDLTSMSLETFVRGVAAHAAVPITQALLQFLPQIKGRMKAADHHQELDGRSGWYHSTRTAYNVTTKDCDEETLSVETVHGRSNSGSERWAHVHFDYTGAFKTASFSYDCLQKWGSHTDATLRISDLKPLFLALAEDLELPVVRSPESEAQEVKHAHLQEEARARLHRDAEAAMASHRCQYGCRQCAGMKENLKAALELLERPASEYTLPELQTPDAKQRDITFGRLMRALLPREFRKEGMYDCWEDLGFVEGSLERDVEDMIRRAAVDGRKVDEEYHD